MSDQSLPAPSRYLKLPICFDTARLADELNAIVAPQWVEHFNTNDYEGSWRCMALRSMNGQADHIIPLNDAEFLDTEVLEQCPYFRRVLDTFACEKTSVRLMALAPGAVIKPHSDPGTTFEDGLARLHIPLITHPDAVFCIDEETVHFDPKHTWYLNAGCTHAVYNRSTQPRIHLMLDCLPNPWLQDVFTLAGFVPRRKAGYDDPSIHDGNVHAIIAELRSRGGTINLALAAKLEAAHDAH